MKRTSWIKGAIIAAITSLYFGPLFHSNRAQDECSFGNVSNVEYRSLLSRASIGWWRPLPGSDKEISKLLSAKLMELVPNSSDPGLKVAAAHAVLRSIGADFRRFDDTHSPSWSSPPKRVWSYRYLVDINKLFYIAPIFRNMMVSVVIPDPFESPQTVGLGGDPPIVAHLPNILEGFYHFPRNEGALVCPPVPSN